MTTPAPTNAVTIDRLTHRFPLPHNAGERTVLSDLSLTVAPGEIFGLLGPNGGGKTTLFRILTTALRPTSGQAWIFGDDVVEKPSMVRFKIGVIFQNPSLDKQLTLLENIRHQGHLYGLRGPLLEERAKEAMARLSLTERAGDFVQTLSGGLQRRAEIAKGLLHRPPLLLLDEPSTGLDPGARREMWDFLLDLKKQGITLLLTTHLMEEGEKCDRVAILNRGKLVALGTPGELKSRIGGDMVIAHSRDPQALADGIRAKLNATPAVLDGTVRVEIRDGHKFIPTLVETFPGLIDAVSVGKPTLEDVFVRETGHTYGDEGVAA